MLTDMTVSDHLAVSRDAHVRYRSLHDTTKNTDVAGMNTAIQDALDHRLAAQFADPTHTDPAWAIDIFDGRPAAHADLIHFYESFLATH